MRVKGGEINVLLETPIGLKYGDVPLPSSLPPLLPRYVSFDLDLLQNR